MCDSISEIEGFLTWGQYRFSVVTGCELLIERVNFSVHLEVASDGRIWIESSTFVLRKNRHLFLYRIEWNEDLDTWMIVMLSLVLINYNHVSPFIYLCAMYWSMLIWEHSSLLLRYSDCCFHVQGRVIIGELWLFSTWHGITSEETLVFNNAVRSSDLTLWWFTLWYLGLWITHWWWHLKPTKTSYCDKETPETFDDSWMFQTWNFFLVSWVGYLNFIAWGKSNSVYCQECISSKIEVIQVPIPIFS